MRTTKKLIAALLAVTMLLTLFSCDDPQHEHSYSTEWKYDETNHWHVCECGEKSDEAAHELTWDKTKDETKHYQKCSVCGYTTEEVAHTFTEWKVSSEEGKLERACTVCGHVEKAEGVAVADESSLRTAVDNGSKTIYLTNDITLADATNQTITVSKDVSINLNGKTLKSESARVFLVNKGTLTLDNGTVEAKIDGAGSSVIRVSAEEGDAALVLKKDAKVVAPTSYGISAFGDKGTTESKRKITLDIYGTIESGNPCLGGSGSETYDNTIVTMNIYDGAVLTASNDLTVSSNNDKVAIYQPNPGILNIKGGTIISKNGSAVEIRAGEATITGGKLISEASEFEAKSNGNGPTVIGAALAVSQHTTKQNTIVYILGGEFTSASGTQLSVVSMEGNENSYNVNVTGYSYLFDLSKVKIGTKDTPFKGEVLLALTEKPAEAYHGGESVEMLQYLLGTGCKVILLSDISTSKTITVDPSSSESESKPTGTVVSTLDLNGHTITVNSGNGIDVIGDIKLTIKDSSTDKKGTIKAGSNAKEKIELNPLTWEPLRA